MPFVETRLISPTTLTTSASSALYTVPTGYSAIIKQLVVTNITGTAATFTFYIGAASAGNALFSGTSVAANDTVIINLSQVLSTGEVLRALASTGSALNLTVSGVINDGPLASTATYIPDNAITSAKIAAGAVDTTDIANNAVTQGKLATTLSGTTITTNALRSTAIPSPFAGQTCYETDTNRMYVWNGTAWVIPNSPAQNPSGLELVTATTCTSGGTASGGIVTVGSGVTSVVVATAFSSTYDNYQIVFSQIDGSLNGYGLRILMSGVTGSVYNLGGTYQAYGNAAPAGTGATANPSGILIGFNGDADDTFAVVDVSSPQLAKRTVLTARANSSSYYFFGGGNTTATVQSTGFTLNIDSPATMTGGTISVYGYRK